MYSSYDDNTLLSLLATGDEKAFTEIYNRYWEKLFAIAFHYSQSKAMSEEVVQEIFMGLWDRRALVKINELSPYLATSAKFSIFKQLLKIKRRNQLMQKGPAAVVNLFEEESINARFLKEYLDGIVEKMPEKCRIVYKFSRQEGMTIPEIAGAMKISPKTVESHLTRALKLLRHSLQNFNFLSLF